MNLDLVRRKLLIAGIAGTALSIWPFQTRCKTLLSPTPPQTSGPFYPLELPLDDDNDLVQSGNSKELAKGEITHLTGEVVDTTGRPVSNARVEIWQCDANGRYRHHRDGNPAALDPNFQGHGQYQCKTDGKYRFRTIRPVPYPGRTPHIHFAISGPGFEPLITQMYVSGEPLNSEDFLLNSIQDPVQRNSVIVELSQYHKSGEWLGHFQIVLAADGRFEAR